MHRLGEVEAADWFGPGPPRRGPPPAPRAGRPPGAPHSGAPLKTY
jgi:hypothetical protein